MSALFLGVLNLAINASGLILAVIAARLLLKKAPKWISCLLWGLVAVRLLCPFSLESALSLLPSGKVVPENIEMAQDPHIDSGVRMIDNAVNPVIERSFSPDTMSSANPMQVVVFAASVLWLIGMAVMFLYALISFILLKRKVRASIAANGRAQGCDEINSPFILGIFRPVIYVPSGLNKKTLELVIAHEEAHLKRHDHWWKPFGFILLSVYWFNPLCWAAYILFCRDIEAACDEKVIRDKDRDYKAAYSQALLDCSTQRRIIAACPLAFGETGVKGRVKGVLNYRKPAFWVIIVAVIVCIVVAVCFMTDPVKKGVDNSSGSSEAIEEYDTGYETAVGDEPSAENRSFLEAWAQMFAGRNVEEIMLHTAFDVQESLRSRELLFGEGERASFGLSSPWPVWITDTQQQMAYYIAYQDDLNDSGDILYYAFSSEPHVTVWHEHLSFTVKNGNFTITEESLTYLDNIATGQEYDMAYPVINSTCMDYVKNGMGSSLNSNALSSSSWKYKDLFDPASSARELLNLSEDEEKVRISILDDERDPMFCDIQIHFAEDNEVRSVTMVRPWENGIWIPQDYGSVKAIEDLTEAQTVPLQRVDENKMGLTMSTENVTPTGCTLVFEQFGGNVTGELETGQWYELQVRNSDGEWIDDSVRVTERSWEDIAYTIKKDGITKLTVNWEQDYGYLQDGHHRIAKRVMDYRGPGDYDEYDIYAEFDIRSGMASWESVAD